MTALFMAIVAVLGFGLGAGVAHAAWVVRLRNVERLKDLLHRERMRGRLDRGDPPPFDPPQWTDESSYWRRDGQ